MTALPVESSAGPAANSAREAKPLTDGKQSTGILIGLIGFVVIPFAALIAAIPVAWGWGLSWLDIGLFFLKYAITTGGIGVGFHRYLTHGSFKAKRGLRIALAVAGSTALEGNPTQWVADHRRHHQFSDREGDPHSPWRFGESGWGLTKGFFYAHLFWLFKRDLTNKDRFAPDLLADRDIRRIDKLFVPLVIASLLVPAGIGGLVTWSWQGAVSAFFWAGLVRIAVMHHVTFSINSVCHVWGRKPFRADSEEDQARNFWPLAILSFGESWHNLHHADPTCARHGVDRRQIDINARLIWIFEKLGWARDVRWPKADRLNRKRREPAPAA